MIQQHVFERTVDLISYIEKAFKISTKTIDKIPIVPEIENCTLCASTMTKEVQNDNAILLTNIAFNCSIFKKKCSSESCINDKEYFFEGSQMGLVNYKNNIIIAVELIIEYLDLFAICGAPFSAWLKSKTNSYPMSLPIMNVKRNWTSLNGKIHEAFCAASERLEVSLASYKCCDNPKVLLMDGVVASIKSRNLPNFKKIWLHGKSKHRCTTRNERQLKTISKQEKPIFEQLIHGYKIHKTQQDLLKSSANIGVRAIFYCLNDDGSLKASAKRFASFLVKEIASITSLIPSSCLHIIEK